MVSPTQGYQPEMIHEVAMSLYVTLGWDALWFFDCLDTWGVLYSTEICLIFFSWLAWSYGLGPSDVSSPGFNFMFHFNWPSAFPIFRILSYMKGGALLISELYTQNPEEFEHIVSLIICQLKQWSKQNKWPVAACYLYVWNEIWVKKIHWAEVKGTKTLSNNIAYPWDKSKPSCK